jgi:hypothetical protein
MPRESPFKFFGGRVRLQLFIITEECKMAKRRRGKRQINPMYIVAGIVVVAIVALLLLRTDDPSDPGAVNIKDEVPAEWSSPTGVCQAREGVLIGMCCTTWDESTQSEEQVDCSDLVQSEQLQAFFTLGQDRLEKLSSIGFMIRAVNEGNIDGKVRISSISVTTLDGDEEGIDEIESKMASIVGSFKNVKAGSSADFAMPYENRIRLDIPSGINAFQMADGTYTVTINLEFEDENGQLTSAGSRTIDLVVEQEKIAFSIDVVPS